MTKTKLESLIEKKNKLQEQLKAQGREALEEFFVDLFKSEKDLTAVSWYQYFPSFNDGDPCYFSLGEVSFRHGGKPLTKKQAAALDEHPGDSYYAEDSTDEQGGKWNVPSSPIVKKVRPALAEVKDLLEDTFGPSALIVVLPAKDGVVFIESDYDCGH